MAEVSYGQHGGFSASPLSQWLSPILLGIVLLYFWIGLSPFPSLAERLKPGHAVDAHTVINQLVMVAVSLSVIGMLMMRPSLGLVPRLWGVLGLIFIWLLLTGATAVDPVFVVRRVTYVLLTCICACGILLLPRTSSEFAKLMALCVVCVVGLCYFGVLALPQNAIHQSGDPMEPNLAGNWRGYFLHKNTAAAAMVYAAFLGLFLRKQLSSVLGTLIFVAACLFLLKTGGKTSAAMLPAVLIAAWLFERLGWLRLVLVGSVLGAVNFVLLSAAVSRPMQRLLSSYGFDPTFTERTAIWRIALSAVKRSPLTGYGFHSFWDTDAVLRGEAALKNWAVKATSAHNSYLELALHGGLPLVALMAIWMVVLPCRHAGIAFKRGVKSDVTRLFVRMWLFSVLLGCLESVFLTGEQMWFMTAISIFGLQLQAQADPADAETENA